MFSIGFDVAQKCRRPNIAFVWSVLGWYQSNPVYTFHSSEERIKIFTKKPTIWCLYIVEEFPLSSRLCRYDF